MTLYRRKTREIEAVQWGEGVAHPGVSRMNGRPFVRDTKGTLHGLDAGDWILPEPDGSGFYPCTDAIFRELYEKV